MTPLTLTWLGVLAVAALAILAGLRRIGRAQERRRDTDAMRRAAERWER